MRRHSSQTSRQTANTLKGGVGMGRGMAQVTDSSMKVRKDTQTDVKHPARNDKQEHWRSQLFSLALASRVPWFAPPVDGLQMGLGESERGEKKERCGW